MSNGRRSMILICTLVVAGSPLLVRGAPLVPLAVAKIDYLSNIPMTDRFSYPASYPMVEYDYWSPPGTPTVSTVTYRRTDTISVQLTIRNPNPIATVGTFHFDNATYSVGGNEYPITEYSQPITVPATGTTVVEVTLNGMPNFVAAGTFQAAVWIAPSQGMYLDSGLSELIFRTESTPNGLQTIPWLEVLLDACGWASGSAGVTNVSHDITFGLYWGVVFVYDGGQPHYMVFDENIGGMVYRLKSLFDNRSSYPWWTNGDCRDVSGYLHIALSSVGIGSSLEIEEPNNADMLYTNEICPIGNDGSTPPANYAPTAWNFHQIVLQSANVLDSCIATRYDLNGAYYANPPFQWTPDGYWQTQNPGWPGPVGTPYRFWGLVDGYVNVDTSTDPDTFYVFPSSIVVRNAAAASIEELSTGGS